jgi:predicted nucleic acid-binding protein
MNKIRVVIDTNIFISAFLGSKKAKFLLKEIFHGEYELIKYNYWRRRFIDHESI